MLRHSFIPTYLYVMTLRHSSRCRQCYEFVLLSWHYFKLCCNRIVLRIITFVMILRHSSTWGWCYGFILLSWRYVNLYFGHVVLELVVICHFVSLCCISCEPPLCNYVIVYGHLCLCCPTCRCHVAVGSAMCAFDFSVPVPPNLFFSVASVGPFLMFLSFILAFYGCIFRACSLLSRSLNLFRRSTARSG